MSIRFFRRRKPEDLREVLARATVVRSAEAAWPFRGPGRTLQENLEAAERIKRHRAMVPPPE
jgi:hypothetical protein